MALNRFSGWNKAEARRTKRGIDFRNGELKAKRDRRMEDAILAGSRTTEKQARDVPTHNTATEDNEMKPRFMVMVGYKDGYRRFEHRLDNRPRAYESAKRVAERVATNRDRRAWVTPYGSSDMVFNTWGG